jgi:hypothetical protein
MITFYDKNIEKDAPLTVCTIDKLYGLKNIHVDEINA